jgi:hypothetical protein
MTEILGHLGNIASIISLVMTIFIFFSVKNIKEHFIARIRLPGLNKTLKDHSKKINSYLSDFDNNERVIKTEIKCFESTLKNLKSKVPGKNRKEIKQVLRKIKKVTNPITNDEAWEIYNDLLATILTVENILKDIRLEK